MSTIVIAGGHGQIALRLAALLRARGDGVRALIRNPGHEADVRATGAEPVLADLEALDDVSEFVDGADGVVFAAGAGPGSGAERKRTVDLGAAVKLLDGARHTGVRRYLMISAMGAGDPAAGGETMGPYLEAKAQADASWTGRSCVPAGSRTSPAAGWLTSRPRSSAAARSRATTWRRCWPAASTSRARCARPSTCSRARRRSRRRWRRSRRLVFFAAG